MAKGRDSTTVAPRRAKRRLRDCLESGFTLIEISVVVLILAVLLTTATVQLDSYLPSSRSESAARQFLSSLDLARTSSVAYGRAYWVEIDLDESRYRIVTSLNEDGKPAREDEERVALKWDDLPRHVTFGSIVDSSGQWQETGTFRLTFDAVGSSQEVYIHLLNDAGEGYTLTAHVLALTGSSKIILGKKEPEIITEDSF